MASCFSLIVFEFPLRKLSVSANFQGLRYPCGECNSCSMKLAPELLLVKPPQRLTREPARQHSESCGAGCKREPLCFCCRLWDPTIHVYVRMTPISLDSSICDDWQVSHDQRPRDVYQLLTSQQEHSNFKNKKMFSAMRTAFAYDFFASYHHIEGLESPATSAFSVGVVSVLSCPS